MLEKNELLNISKKQKKIALNLINEKKIIETLSLYGKPLIIGSYDLDLMIDEDIDIVVESKLPRESAINTLNDFIRSKGFQKYEFGDFEKFERKNRPKGYIVNLIVEIDNKKWEVEIWFFYDISEYIKNNKLIKSKINDSKKIKILKEKAERKEKNIRKHQLSSYEIYKKYLDIV